MAQIDKRWLTNAGVALHNLPAEDQETLVDKTVAELELRVGNALLKKLSDKQIDQFEKVLGDGGDQLAWLETNYPDYPKVVEAEAELLAKQISQSHDKVSLIMSWDYPLPE